MKPSQPIPDAPAQCGNTPLAVNYRIVQVHPTLRCNLSCHHCYSSSLPVHREKLSLERLKPFLAGAREDGFNVISLSGGEPLLYDDLEELLRFTRSLGFLNAIASNAMLATGQKARACLQYADLVAVSVDGEPPIHDRIRNQEGAFAKMLKGLEVIKGEVGKFGFIHTITDASLRSLLWLTEFTKHHRAQLLQLHPLEMVGRAKSALHGQAPEQLFLQKLFILSFYLKEKYAEDFFLQLDLLHRDIIARYPKTVYQGIWDGYHEAMPLSAMLAEICIDEKGRVLPIGYGIHDRFALGNIHQFSTWKDFLNNFHARAAARLEALFGAVYRQVMEDEDLEIVKWNELLYNKSHALPFTPA